MATQRIAVIAGDGIGKEVMPEGLRVMEAAADRFGIDIRTRKFWDDSLSIIGKRIERYCEI